MNVFIRTDSSVKLGIGHAMRCLTLADELKKRGCSITFVSSSMLEAVKDLVHGKGYELYFIEGLNKQHDYPLPQSNDNIHSKENEDEDARQTKDIISVMRNKVEMLIVDHYGLGHKWESQMRTMASSIVVIDDMADRAHDCDVLLDQNLYVNGAGRYDRLVPSYCRKILGPGYALLRPEFKRIRQNKDIKSRGGDVSKILIFIGGTDPSNETAKAIEAVRILNRPEIAVDVVTGQANPLRDEIKIMCASSSSIQYFCGPENLAEIMAGADLSIGAGGSTTWERCCLGLPTLIISVSLNQQAIAEGCHREEIGIYLGESKNVTPEIIKNELERLICNKDEVISMSLKARSYVTGDGAEKVASILLDEI
jgi:UDP-2,4-diacetamido-2,4,6-trideoxy-beta-L-altropyranose hydrolase